MTTEAAADAEIATDAPPSTTTQVEGTAINEITES